MNVDEPMTFKEVAQHLRVSPRQARRIVKRLKIPVLDLGHRTKRIRPADLARGEDRAAGIQEKKGGRYVE